MSAASPSAASLLAEFVTSALLSHLRHDSRAYDTLLAQLRASVKANDSAAVCRWLQALTGCTALLAADSHTAAFTGLLSILLDHIALPALPARSLPNYTAFLVDFATAAHARPGAAECVLRKLVDSFHACDATEHTGAEHVAQPASADSSAEQIAQPPQVHAAAHAALKRSNPYSAQTNRHTGQPLFCCPQSGPRSPVALTAALPSPACPPACVCAVCAPVSSASCRRV